MLIVERKLTSGRWAREWSETEVAARSDRRSGLRSRSRRESGEYERAEAAGEVQLVTDAWHVLGDARRRRAYDESLQPSGSRNYADTTLGDDLVDAGPAGMAPLVRGLPWLILAAVLLLIFVFTVYAGPNGDDPADQGTSATGGVGVAVDVGDCVTVEGRDVFATSCRDPDDGQVVAVAASPSGCGQDTLPLVAPGDDRVLCVAG